MINLVKLVTFSCKQNMTKRVGLMAPSQQIVDLANTGKFHAIFFTKPPQCVVATGAKVESHPTLTKMLDYEAELAVVIGTAGRDISEEDAMSHDFHYT